MPICVECGESVELNTWNAWNIWFLCKKCENQLYEDAKCPYCRGVFTHLRTSEYKKHIEICKKELELMKNEPKM